MFNTRSAETAARPAHEMITMRRRPPRMRSSAGPSTGATIAKGAIVSSRYSATLPRAAWGLMSKNSEPASEMATAASPAAAAAWVRASHVKGGMTRRRAKSLGGPAVRSGVGTGSQDADELTSAS